MTEIQSNTPSVQTYERDIVIDDKPISYTLLEYTIPSDAKFQDIQTVFRDGQAWMNEIIEGPVVSHIIFESQHLTLPQGLAMLQQKMPQNFVGTVISFKLDTKNTVSGILNAGLVRLAEKVPTIRFTSETVSVDECTEELITQRMKQDEG